MLTQKDEVTLLSKPNNLLTGYHDRVMVREAPEAVCSFYENNADKINGKTVVVRSKKDEPTAASERNAGGKVLFVFSTNYSVTSYFSGVCQDVAFSSALIQRASK